MSARLRRAALVAVLVAAVLMAVVIGDYWRTRRIREDLYAAFAPVRVAGCELKRFGSAGDGGYLACANLLTSVRSAYSYGINGTDDWGCDMSAALTVPTHQYDCYNTKVPQCAKGNTIFHAECIGPEKRSIDGRPFNTLDGQIEANGDAGKHLVIKMDIETWEWPTLLRAPDAVLDNVDQLVVEFHGLEKREYVDTARRLRRLFHVAHVHQNNFLCDQGLDPFPGYVFEVLFVNKRIATADPSVDARAPSPLDAPNSMTVPDCQVAPARSEWQRFVGWLKRRKDEMLATNPPF